MKKNILYIGLVALALQSCDYLDREPLDSISKDKFFSTAGADGLQQYCNNLYPKLIKGHGDPQSYNFGMMEEDFKSDNIYTWEYKFYQLWFTRSSYRCKRYRMELGKHPCL